MQSEARLGYVPHFDVMTIDGQRVRYDDIWQRRNLILILVPPQAREAGARYASQLEARRREFEQENTTAIVTTHAMPKLDAPTSLVADRYGEILHLETGSDAETPRFPDIDELLSWVHFAQIQCPECPP